MTGNNQRVTMRKINNNNKDNKNNTQQTMARTKPGGGGGVNRPNQMYSTQQTIIHNHTLGRTASLEVAVVNAMAVHQCIADRFGKIFRMYNTAPQPDQLYKYANIPRITRMNIPPELQKNISRPCWLLAEYECMRQSIQTVISNLGESDRISEIDIYLSIYDAVVEWLSAIKQIQTIDKE
jgi:hypothetical protein